MQTVYLVVNSREIEHTARVFILTEDMEHTVPVFYSPVAATRALSGRCAVSKSCFQLVETFEFLSLRVISQ